MRRNIVFTLMVIVCFILQSTLFKSLSFGGISPNLLIIVTSAFGFMRGKKAGLSIGFFCGLLQDIFFGQAIGFYALIYMYIGFTNGIFNRFFYQEDIRMPLALISISDLAYSMICYVLLFLLNAKFNFGYYFKHIIMPEVVYTILITIIIYPVILLIHKSLEKKEKRSEKKFV